MGLASFYNDTVTVYNKYTNSDGTETWLPTVLTDVNLVLTHGANVSASGMSDADSAKLFIGYENLLKKYKEPMEWAKLSNSEKAKTFTFASGTDFFVRGDTSEETPLADGFYQYMKKNYDGVFKVSNVDYYTDIMPHMEIGGK